MPSVRFPNALLREILNGTLNRINSLDANHKIHFHCNGYTVQLLIDDLKQNALQKMTSHDGWMTLDALLLHMNTSVFANGKRKYQPLFVAIITKLCCTLHSLKVRGTAISGKDLFEPCYAYFASHITEKHASARKATTASKRASKRAKLSQDIIEMVATIMYVHENAGQHNCGGGPFKKGDVKEYWDILEQTQEISVPFDTVWNYFRKESLIRNDASSKRLYVLNKECIISAAKRNVAEFKKYPILQQCALTTKGCDIVHHIEDLMILKYCTEEFGFHAERVKEAMEAMGSDIDRVCEFMLDHQGDAMVQRTSAQEEEEKSMEQDERPRCKVPASRQKQQSLPVQPVDPKHDWLLDWDELANDEQDEPEHDWLLNWDELANDEEDDEDQDHCEAARNMICPWCNHQCDSPSSVSCLSCGGSWKFM